MAVQNLWSCCSLFLGLFLTLTRICFAAQEVGSHIVYLGNSDASLHPDAIADSHYSLLSNVFDSPEAAKEALIYSYRHGFNGFAAKLTDEQVQVLSQLPSVVSIFPNNKKKLHTTNSWDFLGLTPKDYDASMLGPQGRSIWEDTDYGSNIIIGSLDSGVWPESESYSDHGMGPIPAKWKGICQEGERFNSSSCNRKLIGARYFHKGYDAVNGESYIQNKGDFLSARDSEGHGTHTSSTAAGRFVKHASMFGYASGTAKGGAPNARLAIYKVCWPEDPQGGECYEADILAALDQGIHDGVDVFTLSLGSPPPLPPLFQDSTAVGAFHAIQRGIVVVCSAGNSGPATGTVGNVAPWIITVGASSLDRKFAASVKLGNKMTFEGQTLSKGKLQRKMYPLVASKDVPAAHSNSTASELCKMGSLDPRKVKGKIVACLRGENARIEKGAAVLQAGGAGMILCNAPANGNELVADAHFVPAAQISAKDGDAVFSYINSTHNPVAYVSPGRTDLNVKPAPTMAAFSSVGPNSLLPDILKPDITAPGLNILAAFSEAASPSELAFDTRRTKYSIMSGTSMSCPHVAGIAALLKAYHPDWSPAAIKSAMVTTGFQLNNKQGPILDSDLKNATPFHYGGGHVNPNAAAHPGLVYDATEQDYLAFVCGLHYNRSSIQQIAGPNAICHKNQRKFHQSDLNSPSIVISDLRRTRTITRTVTNVGDHETTYYVTVEPPKGVRVTVHPIKLVFQRKGEQLSFQVTFKVHEVSHGDYVYGSMVWSNNRHTVRSPLVVNATQV